MLVEDESSVPPHGVDLAGPSNVYVITHQEWNAVKIGIGACTGYTSRLTQHERQGWQLYQVRDYPTGAAAQDVEQAVLGRLRAAGLAPSSPATSRVVPIPDNLSVPNVTTLVFRHGTRRRSAATPADARAHGAA
ncbi:hypothetical protein [Streptomyces mirabilis]|uniref:hypothetical protein n=1 Tax=Streptomyces mirabilis TaxID=68239 RepID=UPI00367FECCB